MKLEETLNGGYNGLYGEVVTQDCYRLKQLKFIPDIIFDFGANVGIFSRFARELFPEALIISVEPHKENFEILERFTDKIDGKTVLLNKAIGKGDMWRATTASNGAGEAYLSEGLGYLKDELVKTNGVSVERTNIESAMPSDLIAEYLRNGMKSVLKLDIEGGENVIWGDKASMDAIKSIDYIAGEIHFYSLTAEGLSEVRKKTEQALNSFKKTHTVEIDNVNFWATNKKYANKL